LAISYERIRPATGGGNSRDDGHHDATIMVIQRDDDGFRIDPETQRVDQLAFDQASAVAQPPPGLGLSLDNYRVERYGTTDSALLWTFQYSNDNWFNLGQIAGGDLSIPNGNFNQTPITQQFVYPALIKAEVALIANLGPPTIATLYKRILLPAKPERIISWKVKTTSDYWNSNVAEDIAARVGTMHNIGGRLYQFNGISSLRQINSTSYEIVYEWLIDPGQRLLVVASDQDIDTRLILPTVVPSGDPALNKGFGFPTFDGDVYIRLPYHAVTIGQPADPADQPPFIQFVTTTFSASNQLDWQLLPGDPITAAGGP
jgi:hypothetical protein